jgi:cellulose synthase/poly-beta-1,6-N-acetylglucosamine synthase-like glycosyltransferase
LQALTAQNLAPDTYEIIVVNDAPDEATRRVFDEVLNASRLYALTLNAASSQLAYTTGGAGSGETLTVEPAGRLTGALALEEDFGVRLRYIPSPAQRGPAAARNLGWRAAEGEMIAFTDDDCIPSPGWLKHGLEAFAENVTGVQGRVIVPLTPDPTDYELNVTGLETSDFVTANCFYRRSALEEMGGFDEDFTMAWLEDRDLWFRMQLREARLERAEEAVVIHPVRPAQFGVSLSQQRKSVFNALLYRKHPEMYVRMQPPPPYRYYAILTCLLGMVVSLLGGSLPVFAVWAAIWTALTAQFSALRLKRTSHAPLHVLEMAVTSMLIPPLSVYWRLRGALRYRVFFF